MLGSLGLLRHLSALGRAESPVSRKVVSTKLKRLDPELQRFFKDLKKREDEKVKAAQDERAAQIQMFFAQYMPEPVSYKKEDSVVSAFVLGEEAAHSGMKTDGITLQVNGRTVASRDPGSRRFVKVCPGAFGSEKQGRRAANAALKILGAHLRVDDKNLPDGSGGAAFLRAIGHPGHVVHEDDRCYTVEVSRKIQEAALRAAYAPGTEYAPLQRGTRAALPVAYPVRGATAAEWKKIQQEAKAAIRAEVAGRKKKLTKAEQKEVSRQWKKLSKELKAEKAAVTKAAKAAKKIAADAAKQAKKDIERGLITLPDGSQQLLGLRRRR
jgi:hypothetical protein